MAKAARKITFPRLFRFFSLNIFFICALTAALVLVLSGFGLLDRFELTTLDFRFKLRPQKKGISELAIIEIAEDSIQQVGRWPWSRDWHVELINILSKAKAKIIDIDILFSEKSDVLLDSVLASAIKKAGNVYLPFVFEQMGRELLMVEPLPFLAEGIRGTGYINVLPDEDGVIRRVELMREFAGKRYYHIGFKVACDYLGAEEENIIFRPKKFIELRKTKIGNIRIPIDKDNRMILNWPASWEKSFEHFSFIDIIVSAQQLREGKKPRVDLGALKDRICTVGLTATGLTDIKPIPLQPLYPALGVHSCIIDNVYRRDFIRDMGRGYGNLISIFFAFLVACIYLLIRKPARFAFFNFILALGYALITVFLFNFKGIWINAVYPLSSIALSYTVVTLYSQILFSMEKSKLYRLATTDSLTGLFVIGHFNMLLDAKIEEARANQRKLSLLMVDIDHFKDFNDNYGHLTGDFILKEVAKICRSSGRELDILGRYGGEEFILMLPNTDTAGAMMLAERIRQSVESRVFVDSNNKSYRVNISLGVAEFEESDSRETLVDKADKALYRAKNTGRNKVCDFRSCKESKEKS
ncbi:MAG: diguanylate cyclase [Candidatus Omnitrophica bacterium]|nr:diguanylate cyclase [Candidatus Omnitrophota bacterium]